MLIFDEWVRHDVGRIGVQNFLESLLVATGKPANLCIVAETCGRVLAVEHDGGVYSCDHFVDPAHRLGDVASDGIGPLVEGATQRRLRRREARLPAGVLPGVPGPRLLQRGLPEGPLCGRPGRRSRVSTTSARAIAASSGTSSPTSAGWPRSRNSDDPRPRSWASSSSPSGRAPALAHDLAQRPLPVRQRREVQALLPADSP